MEYTLDSEHLVRTALKKQFYGYRVESTQVILVGSEMLEMNEKEKRYFFGILTVSDNRKALLTYNQNELIEVVAGSQIGGQLFTAADFKDLEDNDAQPEGLFLGHEINVLPL